MHCQLERPLRIISHHIFIAEFEAISEDINQKFGSDAQDSPKKAHRLAKATRKLQICGLFTLEQPSAVKTESPSELARFFTEKSADSSKAEAFLIL